MSSKDSCWILDVEGKILDFDRQHHAKLTEAVLQQWLYLQVGLLTAELRKRLLQLRCHGELNALQAGNDSDTVARLLRAGSSSTYGRNSMSGSGNVREHVAQNMSARPEVPKERKRQ